MHHWKRLLLALGGTLLVLGILVLVLSVIGMEYLVDIWWFGSLGYEFYYWQRLLYRYVIFFGVTLVFFLIFFLNFWVASRHLGTTAPPPSSLKPTSMQVYKDLLKMFRTGSMWIYTPLSVILTIPIALPLFENWQAFLFYIFGPESGLHDPVYGKDVSYYLFVLPIYLLLQRRLLIAFLLLLAGLSVLYWLEKRLLSQKAEYLPQGARWHLSILILLVFFIEIWGFLLQTYSLLYNTNHEPLFFGPGFVEMRFILPLIWLSLFLLMGTAISLVYYINRRRGLGIFAVFAVFFLLALGARSSSYLPMLIEKYIVKPNEITRERPFIINNINATLGAYKLDDIEIRDFNPERIPVEMTSPNLGPILRNIPVWDGELLGKVYQQLQELRTYYTFPTINIGRYTVNSNYQQVFLAARELNYDHLPAGAHNWINEHLSYTHGYGAAMTPAAQGGNEPMTWFIQGIPPKSEYGFKIKQPGIYYGLESYNYVIVPNNSGEIDYPKGNDNVMVNYAGSGGVPVSSLFNKFIFAFYYKEKNIFFTTKTNAKSKILFRRNIVERIRTLTPYLLLDKLAYLVVTPDHLYWIQDAYTTSDWYPYSAPFTTERGPINYIRNSVKIVVDAYNGSVDYYVFDPKDPIIRAYSRIYPGVFKSMDQMPPELMDHVRYPKDLFNIQMYIYAKYHQTDPEVFYQQEDIWEFARTFSTLEKPGPVKPYYLTLDLIEPGRLDFLLLCPMIPKGRDNLRALPIVGCDRPYYGKIIVYNFPKGQLVYGPSQIYALINQDTTVAQQFTLWDQLGSNVGRGRMIILPLGKLILYIQPVYLYSSTQVQIPQLQRLIMSDGQHVSMQPSLEEDYANLRESTKQEDQRIEKRFGPAPASGTQPPPAPQSMAPGSPPAHQ